MIVSLTYCQYRDADRSWKQGSIEKTDPQKLVRKQGSNAESKILSSIRKTHILKRLHQLQLAPFACIGFNLAPPTLALVKENFGTLI
jgi:hypothetical protein